jgi:hypothetical protein
MLLSPNAKGLRPNRTVLVKQARIAKAMSDLGLALPGSIEVRSTRCDKANCRCKTDPPSLLGPCIVWTRKIDQKTVTRVLSTDQLADYRPLSDNARRLRELVTDLQTATLNVVEGDDRWRSRQPPGPERLHRREESALRHSTGRPHLCNYHDGSSVSSTLMRTSRHPAMAVLLTCGERVRQIRTTFK